MIYLKNSETLYTEKDLREMQGWSLSQKILTTQTRLLEWYKKYGDKAYVSFSGGKDSTVMADIAAKVCKINGCKLTLWFSDTGLEFPELKTHVKEFAKYLKDKYDMDVNLVIDHPTDRKGNRISFKDVILKNGYPIISKEVAKAVSEAKKGIEVYGGEKYKTQIKKLNGELLDKNGNKSSYNLKKWKFLLDAPFKTSSYCCYTMKKGPARKFNTRIGGASLLLQH